MIPVGTIGHIVTPHHPDREALIIDAAPFSIRAAWTEGGSLRSAWFVCEPGKAMDGKMHGAGGEQSPRFVAGRP